ncbi:DUF1566 domain-containing protein [bacterium]|nr:DUF1566 domain-containing protein [bacterium]
MTGFKRLIPIGLALLLAMCSLTSLADERFKDNGDGTVTDSQLNLMWLKTDNQGDIGWLDGLRWVKYNVFYLLPENKYDDWRLPTISELKSLYVDNQTVEGVEADCGMTVRIIPQISLSCGWVWSSESSKISATVFTFREGYQFSDLKMHKKAHRVLAVRDIK